MFVGAVDAVGGVSCMPFGFKIWGWVGLRMRQEDDAD